MVPADSVWIPRVPTYSGGYLSDIKLTRTGLSPSMANLSRLFRFINIGCGVSPATPVLLAQSRFGLFPFRSPLLRKSMFLSFPAGTKMFQFSAFAYTLQCMSGLLPDGLPHSDICGSSLVCRSPQLFAAYHVLIRQQKPRHPPFALSNFSCAGYLSPASGYYPNAGIKIPTRFLTRLLL